MIHRNEGNRTEVATFRMPIARIDLLKQEAKNRRVNANVLVNQIVESYFEFHLVASNAGMMPVPKRLLRAMVDQLSQEEIAQLCESAAQFDIPDLVYMKRNKFTLESFLDTLLVWTRFSGFQYRDTFEDEKRTITIQHNMGPNWSQFIIGLLEIIFKNLEVKVSFERPDDMIVITIGNK